MRLSISGGFLCVLNYSVWDIDNFHFQPGLLVNPPDDFVSLDRTFVVEI